MEMKEIIECALQGNAVLFLGAGFSIGAENFTARGRIPGGKDLCKDLIEDGKIDVTGESDEDISDLPYISQRYLENNTRRDLLRLFKNEFMCKKVTEDQEYIASLPWKKIYTTNYDDVMEVASRNANINREGVETKNRIADIYGCEKAIIHMNGFIQNVQEDDLDDIFKLTTHSYNRMTITDSDWSVALHTDIKNAHAVVFIGYSLGSDMELRNIFACSDELKEKCIFVDYNVSRRKRTAMEEFGQIYDEGLGSFVGEVKSVASTFQPDNSTYRLKSLVLEQEPDELAKNINSDDMVNLFVNGVVKDAILYSSLENDYVFMRSSISQIFSFITCNGKVAIIHSDLSNGKSIIAKQLMVKLAQTSSVYLLKDDVDSRLADDLEYLSQKKGMHYIFVKNYNRIIDNEAWKIISRYDYSNIKYVFTSRSYINDNFYNRVVNDMDLNSETLGLYDVNILTDEEVESFEKLITKYGLWGPEFTKNTQAKRRFISRNCKREVRNVLLELYKAPAVTNKIDHLIKSIEKDELAKKTLLCAFICNILTIPLDMSDFAYIFGYGNVNRIFLDEHSELKELLIVDKSSIGLKSSSIAMYVLEKGNYNDDLLEILKAIVNHYYKHAYSPQYKHLLKSIISFSNLRLVFNREDPDLKEKYTDFYETARKTGYYNDNMFFWIQYALAAMEVQNYTAAGVYLENASALSQKQYCEDSYHVDSLRARLILEKTLYDDDIDNAFDNFEKAHNLICSNKTPERHYPYRQACAYFEYYQKFYKKFSNSQQVAFMFMCTEMKEKIDDYLNTANDFEKNSRRRNKQIKDIARNLDRIIHDMAR